MAVRSMSAIGLIVVCLSCFFGVLRCAAQSAPVPPPEPQPETKLPDSELSALKAIAAKLKIRSDLWNFSLDPCEWSKKKGLATADITNNLTCNCNETTSVCHVVRLELKSANAGGELPDEEFANLTHLTFIDLARNSFTGRIPTTWAKLPLDRIGLISNKLTGEIPKEIGEISTLRFLSLKNNLLEGRIPDSIGNLKNLETLILTANNLQGELPPSMGELTNMTDIRLEGTGISGNFPSFIGNWTRLTQLLMRGMSLEGTFPSTLSALTKLEKLRVSDFKGDGKFPPIEKMSLLKELVLRNCSISGPIPDFLGMLSTNLELLDLSFNHFTGSIPQSFQTLVRSEKLSRMYLTNNKLNGTIPEWAFGTDNIDLSYNFFTGPNRATCQIGSTNLVSSMQSSESKTTTFCLRKNLPCPTKARNYELFINCGGRDVTVNETKYEKDDNSNGRSMFFLPTNQKWAYSSTGDFSGRSEARFLKANTSALKTNIPLYLTARASASSLKYYGLCLQSGNYTVKLHFAEIIFTDDQTYSSLGRRFFDVAIQGKTVLQNFNIKAEANGTGREIVMNFTAYVENTLEIDFRWSGKGTNAVPDKGSYGPLISAISVRPKFKPQMDFDDNGLSRGAIVGIIIGCLLAISLVISISWILLHKNKRENEELKQLKLQGTYFTLRQIKAATKNFDISNKIGEGGFGPVYKGVLPDCSIVAVKQLSSKSKQGNREFLNEIGMISALQHPNLVKLFGCCIEGSQLLLIYEYMKNNSLARALFGPEEARLKLDWQRRRKISLDIARGLAYLHEESRLKIVHRDIKATNILLDKDLNAKISDFGLAKLDDEENTHISTRIAGTMGYMAPEYAMRGHLTEKADVYSYGVVLLEIISGKNNTNDRSKGNHVYLLDWACLLKEQGKLLDLVDPSMSSNYSTIEAERMLNLALMCTDPSFTVRPAMTSVVSMIEGGTLVTTPPTMSVKNTSVGRSFNAFEQPSHDSEVISFDEPWMESSLNSSRNRDAISTSMAAQLLDDGSI